MQTVFTVLNFVLAASATAFWALGMYFWWLLDHSAEPSRAERRRRTINSFIVMGGLGFAPYGLRVFKESIA